LIASIRPISPQTIGTFVSSGCIRLRIDLYTGSRSARAGEAAGSPQLLRLLRPRPWLPAMDRSRGAASDGAVTTINTSDRSVFIA
jgi:hypothetical protein